MHFKPFGGEWYYKVDVPEGEFLGAYLVDDKTGEVIDLSSELTKTGSLNFYVNKKGTYYLILMVIRTLFEGTHCTTNYCEARKYISMIVLIIIANILPKVFCNSLKKVVSGFLCKMFTIIL